MAEDRFRLPQLWRRVLLIGAVLIAGPAMAWSAIWVTRSYIVPARVPAYQPVALAAATPTAPVEQIARVAPASAAGDPYKLAMAGNEILPFPAPVAAPAKDTTGSIARVETVPLPRPKPRMMVAAIQGPVPLPRPRPSPSE
jgi:hypothetical protein